MRLSHPAAHAVLVLLLALLAPPATLAQQSLAGALAALRDGRPLQVSGIRVEPSPTLLALYGADAAEPLWSPAAAAQLQAAIAAAPGDGLPTEAYAPDALRALAPPAGDAGADLAHSAMLLALCGDLYHGKLDAAEDMPGIDLESGELPPGFAATARRAILDASLPALLDGLRPASALYTRLRDALASHRAIAARGGWDVLPGGPVIHPGESDPRLAALQERLRASGDLAPEGYGPIAAMRLEGELEAALRRFQGRHALAVDGVLGKQTLAELNVGVEARIDQIRVNLERARWLLHGLPPDHVLVDIAGFELRYVRDGTERLRSRTVVGKPYRKTPVFRSAIRSVEFNPAWTVPPTILRNDVLPEIRSDRSYLAEQSMHVLDRTGREIDPASIDWNRYPGGRGFPYLVRQDPGPKNPLGRVKFAFPNAWQVYLHDTPATGLFRRAERSLSSGCIRVEQAQELARLLLEAEGIDRTAIDGWLAAAVPHSVALRTPVPVLLHYWTAAIGDDGELQFRRDIYGRDAAVLQALDGR